MESGGLAAQGWSLRRSCAVGERSREIWFGQMELPSSSQQAGKPAAGVGHPRRALAWICSMQGYSGEAGNANVVWEVLPYREEPVR